MTSLTHAVRSCWGARLCSRQNWAAQGLRQVRQGLARCQLCSRYEVGAPEGSFWPTGVATDLAGIETPPEISSRHHSRVGLQTKGWLCKADAWWVCNGCLEVVQVSI